MTTTTFPSKNLNVAAAPGVGEAFRQLMRALLAPLQAAPAVQREESVAEQANRVREMAYDYVSTDPGYADDLFAAADRHEYEHQAASARH